MMRRAFFGWLGGLLTSTIGLARPTGARPQSSYPPPMPPDRRKEFDRLRALALAALPYERVQISGDRALEEWERLRVGGKGWPVIVGDDEQLDAIAQQFSLFGPAEAPSPATILAEAATLDFPQSLERWFGTDPDLPEPPLGAWPVPSAVEIGALTVATDVLSGKPFDRVHILLIPTTNSWEVPAYLRWGDWNACPPAAQHVAALRRWHERFSVEIVGINRDTLNLRARRRPANREAALQLAREQYRYCPDVIDQGAGSLSALAAMLLVGDWWYFWWD